MSILFPAYATTGTTSTSIAGDSTITSVTLLLHGDGANGTNNTGTFVDSSSNNYTITRTGTPALGSINPFGSNWSTYFNGTSDYTGVGSASNWTFLHNGSVNYTVEAWVFQTAYNTEAEICNTTAGSAQIGFEFSINNGSNGNVTVYFFNGTSGKWATLATAGSLVGLNTWCHVAFSYVQSTNTGYIFVNGTLAISGTMTFTGGTFSASAPTNTLYISKYGNASGGWFAGYLSNLRIVNGTALYTSTFTPSTTPLTTVTNTVLLTWATNRFQDTSTSSYSISPSGTSVQRFAPFSTSTSYSTSTTATVYSGSIYFNGSTDYLSTTEIGLPILSTFTLECWVYMTGSSAGQNTIVGTRGASTAGWELRISTSNIVQFYFTTISPTLTSSAAISLNTWAHVAVVRNAGTVTIYLNGVAGSGSSISNGTNSGNPTVIGNETGSSGNFFQGYISNFRIITGQALYTASFTPSTTPLTTSTGTQLLLLGSNAGIVDTTMQNNLVTTGAVVSTTQSKFGGTSMYFNGSSRLTLPTGPNLNLSGNFTIEFWVYFSATLPGYTELVCTSSNGTAGANMTELYVAANGSLTYYVQGSGILTSSAGVVTTNTWYHIALVKNGTSQVLYVNGTSVVSATSSVQPNSGYSWTIGDRIASAGSGQYPLTGYIDDLRITNGVARYTANFTAPTVAFLDAASSTSLTSTTTYTTSFTTANNVYSTVSGTTTGTGGTSYYTTSTGLFSGTSVVHVFTASGFFTATQSASVSYLVVAGGGGGGGNGPGSGGGAGAGGGGMVTGTALLSAGTTYTITVGTGGTGGPISAPSTSGGFSSITSGTTVISTATGGGAGGGTLSTGQVTGQPGGSGGGGNAGSAGGTATQPSQTHPGSLTYQNFGNPGGSGQPGSLGASGGGGGAGVAGSPGNATGGAGTSSYITGSLQYYAGGGGGWNSPTVGSPGGLGGGGPASVAGTSNTGGGGGGGGNGPYTGANGGPGIVVLSYAYTTTSITTIISTGSNITYTYVNGRWSPRPFNTGTLDISEAVFDNQTNTSTQAFALSAGSSSQRPATGYAGQIRFNTALNTVETYSTVSNTWTSLTPSSYTIEYLAVAAGGGASATAGGGAGGALAGFTQVSTGNSYTVAVGQGGSGDGGSSYIALSTVSTSSSTAIAYAYGGSAGTTAGGPSGSGIVGQGYTVSAGSAVTTGTGGRYYTTSTGLFTGTSAVHVFTATGTSYFTASSAITVSYLVVAGGGGGGETQGGGGGAGGLLTGTALLTIGTYAITVGAGGAGSQARGSTGTNGGNSSIVGTGFTTTATGGGGGGSENYPVSYSGNAGGSGGGASAGSTPATGSSGTPGQGNPGGSAIAPGAYATGGGGGGSVSAGTSGGGSSGGSGGTGFTSSITGSSQAYAGGGGGGGDNRAPSTSGGTGGSGVGGAGGNGVSGQITGGAGTPGTGSGGGGGGFLLSGSPTDGIGGTGGPGIVVISYSLSTISQTAGAGAYSSTGTGIFSQVTGAQVTYGAGGAATGSSPGGTNTGNGGSAPGGTGAPGVVYIRYPGTQKGTGGSVSTVGTYTLHTFVSTGTYTA